MLKERLKDYHLILASGSPRRHHFFKELDLQFTVDVRPVDETFPKHLEREAITDHLAQLKATGFTELKANEIIVTSDTIVVKDGVPIGKPANQQEAVTMLQNLSGSMHEVITSVCFTSAEFQKTVNDTTKVWFKPLRIEEIEYYIETYKPYDKAGSYGIQEWIGYIGIERIEGCYFNVMGLPTRLVYSTLMELTSS